MPPAEGEEAWASGRVSHSHARVEKLKEQLTQHCNQLHFNVNKAKEAQGGETPVPGL